MPCFTGNENDCNHESYVYMICQCCKLLTAEQILKVPTLPSYLSLHQYYAEHLLKDAMHNLKNNNMNDYEEALKEAERIGTLIENQNNERLMLHCKSYIPIVSIDIDFVLRTDYGDGQISHRI